MYDVVALGELLVDFTHLSDGADEYPVMAAHPGGAPANFLSALSKYGVKTSMIGKVGNDAFGRMLIKALDKVGIDTTGLVVSDDVFTTLAFVTLDKSGGREFSFARKPGADMQLQPDELSLGIIGSAEVFHFGTLSLTNEPSRSATRKAVEYAKFHGKLITFDPNLRRPLWASLDDAREQMLWGVSQADVVKISNDELEFLYGSPMESAVERIIADFGVKLIFVTCGADGCYYKNALCSGFVNALKDINVLDTTGAGDIFFGATLSELIKLDTPPQMLNKTALDRVVSFGCTAAGLSTTKLSGISSIPSREDVLLALSEL